MADCARKRSFLPLPTREAEAGVTVSKSWNVSNEPDPSIPASQRMTAFQAALSKLISLGKLCDSSFSGAFERFFDLHFYGMVCEMAGLQQTIVFGSYET